jgi:hypothetical protein
MNEGRGSGRAQTATRFELPLIKRRPVLMMSLQRSMDFRRVPSLGTPMPIQSSAQWMVRDLWLI